MDTLVTPDQLFSWAGQGAFYGWLILIFLPRVKALLFIPQYLIPTGIGLLYAGLILTQYSNSNGNFSSLDDVRILFESDHMLLAGWVHYLAFDLFIGAWVARKADQIGISRLLQAPILSAIYLFGPIGLILFLFMRTVFTQTEEHNYAS